VQSDEKNYSDCLKKVQFKWGAETKTCNSTKKTYKVWHKNISTDTLAVKVAVQETYKHWQTFSRLMLLPGDTISGFACNATGKYLVYAKKWDDNTTELPSDAEIDKANP
jgi:hypothetical protein